MKYFITYFWRRNSYPQGTYEIAHEITDKHPFVWQIEMNELHDQAAQLEPNKSHPRLNQTDYLLWWVQISDEEARLAGDIFE